MNIQFHSPVMTKDGKQLGLAQRILRSNNPEIEVSPYREHLKVFNFEMGDAFFVPLTFVSADAKRVNLSLTFQEVLNGAFSNMPRYIAYEDFDATELAQ